MSIRSQPHESTGLSPYEMMFGIPMRLPTELEESEIPESATQSQLAELMPPPRQVNQVRMCSLKWTKYVK